MLHPPRRLAPSIVIDVVESPIAIGDTGVILDRGKTETCEFWIDPRGFIHCIMAPGCELDVENARVNVAAIAAIGRGARRRLLVDMRGMRSQTREAREYLTGPEAERAALAVALLVGSPVSRVLGNFFLRLGAHRVPTALFGTEHEALAWLLEQR